MRYAIHIKNKLLIFIMLFLIIITCVLMHININKLESNNNEYDLEKDFIIAYTINGNAPTDNDTYEDYIALVGTTYGADITCLNGSTAIMNSKGEITFTNVEIKDFCTVNFRELKWYDDEETLGYHVLKDNPNRDVRTVFTSNISNTDKRETLFYTNLSEDGSTIYYFAGGLVNNWVIFGKCTDSSYNCTVGDNLYWRIIRTNTEAEGGGLRLIYSGSGSSSSSIPVTTNGYIGISKFNSSREKMDYVGYMYSSNAATDTDGTYLHDNDVDSIAKTYIDTWYNTAFNQYDSYINKNAIYCGDRSYTGDISNQSSFYFGSTLKKANPSYKCGYYANGNAIPNQSNNDKYVGLGAALLTYEEAIFAGGYGWATFTPWIVTNSYIQDAANLNDTVTNNIATYSITGINNWTTMSPFIPTWKSDVSSSVIRFLMDTSTPRILLHETTVSDNKNAIRPVISLKADVEWASGDGSSSNPYILK